MVYAQDALPTSPQDRMQRLSYDVQTVLSSDVSNVASTDNVQLRVAARKDIGNVSVYIDAP
jgi:hypothetical protein